jgi:hypothetical protein
MLFVALETEFGLLTIRARSLKALSTKLARLGYFGTKLKAFDRTGWLRGWVTGNDYRPA